MRKIIYKISQFYNYKKWFKVFELKKRVNCWANVNRFMFHPFLEILLKILVALYNYQLGSEIITLKFLVLTRDIILIKNF